MRLLDAGRYDLQLGQKVVDLEGEVCKDADGNDILDNVEGRAQSGALEAVSPIGQSVAPHIRRTSRETYGMASRSCLTE